MTGRQQQRLLEKQAELIRDGSFSVQVDIGRSKIRTPFGKEDITEIVASSGLGASGFEGQDSALETVHALLFPGGNGGSGGGEPVPIPLLQRVA